MEYADRTYYTIMADGSIITLDGQISKVSEGVGLIEYLADTNSQTPEKRYEFITSEGKIIKSYKSTSGKEYFFIKVNEFSEGFAAVAINKGSYENSWGFLKRDGTWLIEPIYSKAGSFKNGVAPVKSFLSWGYINTDLTWFIEPKAIEPISKPHSAFADLIDSGLYTQSEHDYCIDKAQTILKDIVKDSMSDYEKLASIYDYITENVKYDYINYAEKNIPRVSFTAYGALKYNIAVCNGYSNVLNLMLNLAGIENKQVTGVVKRSGFAHSWNLVKIDGKYYHVDATWDAENNKKQYFMKSDEYMLNSRTWNNENYPKAEKNYR